MEEQLEKDYKKETHASYVDSLTGLHNHGIFQILLEEEIKRSQRYADPFTLALIDIDSFSSYNKRHNPAIGDRALKEVAKHIRENIRNPDVASRYSGDVFAVIFPKSSVHEAYTAVDRVRGSVETHTHGALTVSAGLVSCPKEASNKEILILKAQEALLQAKVRGKNKVCFLDEERKSAAEQKFKILIVDDEPRNVKLLGAVLAPFNHEIFKAYNGEEALSVVKKTDIDLVLLDIMMPYMDGYEVCRRLKRSEATRLVPIVMVTALEAIRHHHEKIDGSGYPDGIKGEEISILARIMAVVDIFDALDTDRPYRKGMPREKTFKILREEADEGKLDNRIVEHLMETMDRND